MYTKSHKILMQTQIDRHTAHTFVQSNSERCEVILISFQAAGNFVVYCELRAWCFFLLNTLRTPHTVEEKRASNSNTNHPTNQMNWTWLLNELRSVFFSLYRVLLSLCSFHSVFVCWCFFVRGAVFKNRFDHYYSFDLNHLDFYFILLWQRFVDHRPF